MKCKVIAISMLSAVALSVSTGFCDTAKGEKPDGKKEFEKHCSSCHQNGGNIINAQKPLNRKALKKNGLYSTKSIIAKMRQPGPGMPAFDESAISKTKANAIAEYIMKAF